MEEGIQQLLQAEHNHREGDQRGGSRTGVQGGHRQNHEVLHGWAGAQLTGLMVSYPLPLAHAQPPSPFTYVSYDNPEPNP